MTLKTVKSIFILLILFASNAVIAQSKDSLGLEEIRKQALKEFKNKSLNFYELEGKPVPEFNLKLLNGGTLTSESLKGKPTLINFWHTNCSPCIEEIPILNEIVNKFGKQVNFISITFQDEKEVSDLLSNREFNFTHIIDSWDYIKAIGLPIFPKTMILGKDLVIKSTLRNVTEEIEFKSHIVQILTELLKVH